MPPRAALALAAALLLAGCPRRAPPPDLSADAEALRAQVVAAQDRVRSCAGDARLKVAWTGGPVSLPQYVAAEKPDRLHVETFDFFGNALAVLVARDGRFALYDAREKVYYRGPATPENLARLVPLPLPAEDLVTLLCGSAPLLDAPAVLAEPGSGFMGLDLAGRGRRQSLAIGAGAAILRSERTGGVPGAPDYVATFSGHRTRGGVPFPTTLALTATSPEVELELRWKDVEVNAELDAALFRLEPPAGARVVELDGAAPGPRSPFEPADPAAAGRER